MAEIWYSLLCCMPRVDGWFEYRIYDIEPDASPERVGALADLAMALMESVDGIVPDARAEWRVLPVPAELAWEIGSKVEVE